MATRRWRFDRDVELDARLVLAGIAGGREGIVAFAFLLRDRFPDGPDQALARGDWLSGSPRAYIEAVSDRAAAIEAGA